MRDLGGRLCSDGKRRRAALGPPTFGAGTGESVLQECFDAFGDGLQLNGFVEDRVHLGPDLSV